MRLDLPAPALWPGALAADTPLGRCLLLAALLHLLLVLLLGSAPGGTAQLGQGVFGAINVTLRGAPRGDGPQEATVSSDAYAGPQGTAEQRRWGGAVRPDEPDTVQTQAGAARLGRWQAKPAPELPAEPMAAAPSTAPSTGPAAVPEARQEAPALTAPAQASPAGLRRL